MRLPHAATVVGGSRVNGKDTSRQPPRSPGKQCIPQVEPEACNELKAAQDGKGGAAPPLPRQMPEEGGRLLLLLLLRPLACARENPDRNYFSAAPHAVPN